MMLIFQHFGEALPLPVAGHLGRFRRVDLSTCLRMDPHLLVGLLNTELRNHCSSLDDLVKTHHVNRKALVEKLEKADYTYRPEQNQFR